MTTTTHILGYPRIGEKRELKFAQEKYWRGEIDQAELKKSVRSCATKTGKLKPRQGLALPLQGISHGTTMF